MVRAVDYDRRDLDGIAGVVERVEADPNRSGFLALTRYEKGVWLSVGRGVGFVGVENRVWRVCRRVQTA